MLNELRELALCLEKAGIKVHDLHANFKSCPKYLTYWVYIDEQGNVDGIAPVPSEQIQKLRKWERANGISFPAFNMPPIFKAQSEEQQGHIKAIRKNTEKGVPVTNEWIQAIADSCEILWDEESGSDGRIKYKYREKLTDCLTKPVVDISGCLDTPPAAYASIAELCRRTKLVTATAFRDQLAVALLQSLQDAPSADLLDALFFYSGKIAKNFQIILELSDWDCFEYPANHKEVQSWMNGQFLAQIEKPDCSDLDAFGCNATGKDSKFPPVGFKNALGNVILRAMNQESPCQTRYGMIDYHSFPAGDQVRKGMKSALEWLGSEVHRGKTWCDLSRRMEKPMLLFAYPSIIPQDLPDLAGMMGEVEDSNAEINDELFAALAERITTALRGDSKETIDCEIRVFVLSKMDKARTKVITSNRFTADHVILSARNWQVGCCNLPIIEVRCFGKNKGDKTIWRKPLIPFPVEVIWCLNTVWTTGRDEKGERYNRANNAHGFTVNDALCLLLGKGVDLRQTAERALGALLRNSSSLLLALGQAQVMGRVVKTDRKYFKQTLLIPSILGLLLYRLEHMKGETMSSPAFQVGRLLNLADSLHHEYCKGPRKNSFPPQLVGNALMATAQEEPIKALAVLWGRIKPYHAWAQTLKEGESVGLVKFFLKHLGDVTAQLDLSLLPQRCTDTDKAQMLLGYLARFDSVKN